MSGIGKKAAPSQIGSSGIGSTAGAQKKRTLLDDFCEMENMKSDAGMNSIASSSALADSMADDSYSYGGANAVAANESSVSRIHMESQASRSAISASMASTRQKVQTETQAASNGRHHAPQIIDEDTEHFRVKIDHLLNVFKTDAIAEFMGMKRSMLDDQRTQVNHQTERYLAMYEDKHHELSETKEKLDEQTRINAMLRERLEKMSCITQKAKSRFHTMKALSMYFQAIKNYKILKSQQKNKSKLAVNLAQKNLKSRVFNSFVRISKEEIHAAECLRRENVHGQEIDEITHKYNKEMSTIKEQLLETQTALQQVHVTKESMQENLKKAFMRGVCALNFEAMNVIQGPATIPGFNPSDLLPSIEPTATLKNVSQATSTYSQNQSSAYSQQQQQTQQQQQQQQEHILMHQIVQKNPQQFNSLLINPVEPSMPNNGLNSTYNNSNSSNSNPQSNYSSNANMTSISSASVQQKILQNADNLDQEKWSQIEFLKKELESIQRIAGQNPQQFEAQQQQASWNDGNVSDDLNSQQKKIVIFQEQKAESKDHRWKNAPVVGVPTQRQSQLPQQSSQPVVQQQQQIQQQQSQQLPLSQPFYNKENLSESALNSIPNFIDNPANGGYDDEEECKVIRVNPAMRDPQPVSQHARTVKSSSNQPLVKPPMKDSSSVPKSTISNSSSVLSSRTAVTSTGVAGGKNTSSSSNLSNSQLTTTSKSSLSGTPSKSSSTSKTPGFKK